MNRARQNRPDVAPSLTSLQRKLAETIGASRRPPVPDYELATTVLADVLSNPDSDDQTALVEMWSWNRGCSSRSRWQPDDGPEARR